MNWFEPSLSFNPRFEPKHTAQMFLPNTFQLDPLVNSLSQNIPRLPVPYTNAMNHITHDLLAGPTKRVRHTQNNFTQITPKLEDIARLSQEQKRISVESPEAPVIVLHKPTDSDLVIPPLSGLNFAHQRRPENMIPHQQNIWQQMQRQQQNFEKFMQHQIAQQIEHQKLELNQMMYRIHEAYRMQATVSQERSFANLPELQMNHLQAQRLLNSQKLVELGESSLNVKNLKAEISPENSTEFKGIDEEDYRYVKLEEMKERVSDKSTEGGSRRSSAKTEEDKAKICQMVTKTVAKEQPKKRKNQNSSAKYFNIFEENLVKKNREGPRGKNKWQKMTTGPEDEQPVQVEQPVVKMVEEPVEIPQIVQKVKPERVPEIPQHLQDDSLIDYQGMLATTISDDPMYVGDENKGFVVIKKVVKTTNDDGEDTIINGTRVGGRYQAVIPEMRQKGEKVAKGRKRCPELVWKAGAIHENEMKRYYDDICKILKCENVNEERALKLLKRKNFKKEKVKVNITKNEKFYASFLVVTENMGIDNNGDNTSQ